MPFARAAVRQTGGRTPLGLVEKGTATLIVNSLDVPHSPHSVTAFYNGSGNFKASTSNTIAFGESLGGGHTYPRDTVNLWPGGFLMGLRFGLRPYGGRVDTFYGQFSSRHTGGIVNFGFADGSVRSIGTNVDWAMFDLAGAMADGLSVNADMLGAQ